MVVLGAFSGALSMGLLAWLRGERQMLPAAVGWALAAGVLGAVGLAALYRGLASGSASLVAPTAAVVGTALPVIGSMLLEGLPEWKQSMGLLFGLAGIWQVSSSAETPCAEGQGGRLSAPGLRSPGAWRAALGHSLRQPGLAPAILAGLAFGAFFLCLAQSENQGGPAGGLRPIFLPLMVSKIASLLTAILLVFAQRQPLPALRSPLALLSGVLDAGGNLFYLLAQQLTRLDIAVTISSMYPVSTVVLAAVVLKQKVDRRHGLGLALCLAALALLVA